MTTILPNEQYHYSQDERLIFYNIFLTRSSLEYLIHSVKGNKDCKN